MLPITTQCQSKSPTFVSTTVVGIAYIQVQMQDQWNNLAIGHTDTITLTTVDSSNNPLTSPDGMTTVMTAAIGGCQVENAATTSNAQSAPYSAATATIPRFSTSLATSGCTNANIPGGFLPSYACSRLYGVYWRLYLFFCNFLFQHLVLAVVYNCYVVCLKEDKIDYFRNRAEGLKSCYFELLKHDQVRTSRGAKRRGENVISMFEIQCEASSSSLNVNAVFNPTNF